MKTFFLILIFTFSTFAQTDLPIVGKLSDLAGKTKVYVSSETTKSRELIEKTINKNKSFEIVADPVKADFILEFKQISKSAPAKVGMGTFDDTAEMTVYFYNAEKRKVVAWSQTKNMYEKKGWGMPKKNETYLTGEFIKALKQTEIGK